MSDLYIDQPVLIELECPVDGQPLSTGVAATIEVKKPGGALVTWAATVDNVGGLVTYQATAEEIDIAGTWKLQPIVEFVDGKQYPGVTTDMIIKKRFT